MVINYIDIEDGTITVGATDLARWHAERDAGDSGADAKTLVFVTLQDEGPLHTLQETATLHCLPGDPHRGDSIRSIAALFNIAHCLRAGAANEFFGLMVG